MTFPVFIFVPTEALALLLFSLVLCGDLDGWDGGGGGMSKRKGIYVYI